MRTRGLSWLLSLSTLLGCAGMPDDARDEAVEASESALNTRGTNWYKGTVDQSYTNPQDHVAELDLLSGRATGLPVSKAWFGKKVFNVPAGTSGTHDFKAACLSVSGGTASFLPSSEDCDTGMLVKRTVTLGKVQLSSSLLYADNDTDSDNSTGGSQVSSSFASNTAALTYTYEIVVFSKNRQSSHANIWWGTDGGNWHSQFDAGGGHDVNGWNRYVGGTVVRLGALKPSDYVEVRTRHDGATPADKTWMWVFPLAATPSATGTTTVNGSWLFANYAGPTEFDPKITIPSSDARFADSGAFNYAILSRESWDAPLETFADLVRGPLSYSPTNGESGSVQGTAQMNGGAACTLSTCTGAALTPARGRYSVSVWATPAAGRAVASTQFASPLSREVDAKCEGGSWAIGAPNVRAFRASLQKLSGSGVWLNIATRDVPMAALGDETMPSAISFDLDATDDTSSYRVQVTNNELGNSVVGAYSYRRNPDSSTLKVATFNTYLHNTGDADRNAAWLLGRRAEYDETLGRVLEHPSRAPYEQEADVIAMQEIADSGLVRSFTNELNGGIKKFDVSQAQLEYSIAEIVGVDEGTTDGALWVSELAKGRYASSAIPRSTLADAGCVSSTNHCGGSGAACTYSCDLGESSRHRDAFPVRGAARRLESNESALGTGEYGPRDKPIMFVNLHYHNRDSVQRLVNVRTMANKLATLTRGEMGLNYFDAEDEKDNNLRIVLIGDSNGYHQDCGEMNSWLRELRQTFGYAAYVPMVAVDQDNRTIDNYFGGAPLDEQGGLMQYLCSVEQWALPNGVGTGLCPKHYQGSDNYKNSNPTYSNDSWYHWWEANNDIVVLVGRGWRGDDPVQGIKTLSEHGYGPNTDKQAGGVSNHDLNGDAKCADRTSGYWPRYNVFGSGVDSCTGSSVTSPGSVAHRSDHSPVVAKLRISN